MIMKHLICNEQIPNAAQADSIGQDDHLPSDELDDLFELPAHTSTGDDTGDVVRVHSVTDDDEEEVTTPSRQQPPRKRRLPERYIDT